MKRIIAAAVIAAIMAGSLLGCGAGQDQKPEAQNEAAQEQAESSQEQTEAAQEETTQAQPTVGQ